MVKRSVGRSSESLFYPFRAFIELAISCYTSTFMFALPLVVHCSRHRIPFFSCHLRLYKRGSSLGLATPKWPPIAFLSGGAHEARSAEWPMNVHTIRVPNMYMGLVCMVLTHSTSGQRISRFFLSSATRPYRLIPTSQVLAHQGPAVEQAERLQAPTDGTTVK
jgi:hypothetical protein